jgi:hypothetical protein
VYDRPSPIPRARPRRPGRPRLPQPGPRARAVSARRVLRRGLRGGLREAGVAPKASSPLPPIRPACAAPSNGDAGPRPLGRTFSEHSITLFKPRTAASCGRRLRRLAFVTILMSFRGPFGVVFPIGARVPTVCFGSISCSRGIGRNRSRPHRSGGVRSHRPPSPCRRRRC